MAARKIFVVTDPERALRDQLDELAELRIFGTNSSEVVRVLVAQAHAKYCRLTSETAEKQETAEPLPQPQ